MDSVHDKQKIEEDTAGNESDNPIGTKVDIFIILNFVVFNANH